MRLGFSMPAPAMPADLGFVQGWEKAARPGTQSIPKNVK